MGLVNGSDEYWKIDEHAERIYRKKCNAYTSSEKKEWTEKGKKLADRLIEKYGFDDEMVSWIINKYYLDRD